MPILAEDLGVITPDVDSLREAIEAPGMLVLQFAWGGDAKNLYLPHNHYENAFVYPGACTAMCLNGVCVLEAAAPMHAVASSPPSCH